MSDHEALGARRIRRATERANLHAEALEHRDARHALRDRRDWRAGIRKAAFGGIVVGVLGVGGALAFGDFLDRPSAGTATGRIDIQSSMAGFTPGEIRVTAGQTVTLNWWTDDAAPHLEGGVHTMVAPDLDLYEELPAEGTRLITWTVPDKPGTYDVWCDSCCGGKASPSMHGTIVVEPVSADASGQRAG